MHNSRSSPKEVKELLDRLKSQLNKVGTDSHEKKESHSELKSGDSRNLGKDASLLDSSRKL